MLTPSPDGKFVDCCPTRVRSPRPYSEWRAAARQLRDGFDALVSRGMPARGAGRGCLLGLVVLALVCGLGVALWFLAGAVWRFLVGP